MRSITAIAIGFALAAAVVALATCAIDPNPPNPHGDAGWSAYSLIVDGGDGGEAEQ